MRNYEIESEMYQRVIELIEKRYPSGWGGVTHCMCLIRDDEESKYRVLSPCGICQERLRDWGEDMQMAVTTEDEDIRFIELKELQPYHWTRAYPADDLEHWEVSLT